MTSERELMKQKVVKLLNLTVERGASEAEAVNAAEKAGELMAFWDIDITELQIKNTRSVKINVPLKRYARRILADTVAVQIAQFCDCLIWRSSEPIKNEENYVIALRDNHTFFGYKDDGEIAQYLQTIVLSAIENGIREFKKSPTYVTSSHNGRLLVNSFILGMESRLNTRFKNLKKEKAETVERETTGRSLVPLKVQSIKDEADELGFKYALVSARNRKYEHQAFSAGQKAAEKVNLSRGINEQDFQRSRVYEWENETLKVFDEPKVPFQNLQSYVDYIWSDMGFKYPPKIIKIHKNAKRVLAHADRMEIHVPEAGLQSTILLHELAHSMTCCEERGSARHGPRYMGVYINLLVNYAKLDRIEIERSLLKSGIKYNYKGAVL